jgi:hypothetical protein
MQSRQVTLLCAVAQRVDDLHKALNEVPFLKDAIRQKRDFEDIEELGQAAQAALARTRVSLAKKGGGEVAKGWK